MGESERYVAFLRAINVGGRRVSGDDLAAAVEAAEGVADATSYLASGNVVFSAAGGSDPSALAGAIGRAIEAELGFGSKVFLRSAAEITDLAGLEPFSEKQLEDSKGKPQISFYAESPTEADRRAVLAHTTDTDPLALEGRDLHWLPAAGTQDSDLDWKAIERTLGPSTMRTQNTIRRLRKKFFN